mmetsp:Transcript_42279/g.113644  ORF Transcript_42279/g.113644 Transcript_42279/m.113644 type:complete len:209 (-) Transcript_42279:251-877(-)
MATVEGGKRKPCVTREVVGPSGSTRIHHAQSRVTLSCSVGKMLTKKVEASGGTDGISGKGAASPGSGTIERSPGTWTASQSPCGWTPLNSAIGQEGIGPRESLWTMEVWYVSDVFSIKNFQLHSTTYSLRQTVTSSSSGQSPSASSTLPRASRSGGASTDEVTKRNPRYSSRRNACSGQSAFLKQGGISWLLATPLRAPLVGSKVHAW